MGKCKFCGQNAGILRDSHWKCKSQYEKGRDAIVYLVRNWASGNDLDILRLNIRLESIAANGFIRDYEVTRLAMKGWELAVESAIERKDFKAKTETRFRSFAETDYLSASKLHASPIWWRFMKHRLAQKERETNQELKRRQEAAARKRQEEIEHTRQLEFEEAQRNRRREEKVAEHRRKLETEEAERRGRILLQPIIEKLKSGRRIDPNVSIEDTPIILQKSESLIWVFVDADYLVEHRRLNYDSNSKKYSSEYVFRAVESGMLGVTTKHLYFVGDRKRFRIRYDRIVAFKEYDDGVGVDRAAQDASHEKFATGEGWFTYNLVTTLARRYSQSD